MSVISPRTSLQGAPPVRLLFQRQIRPSSIVRRPVQAIAGAGSKGQHPLKAGITESSTKISAIGTKTKSVMSKADQVKPAAEATTVLKTKPGSAAPLGPSPAPGNTGVNFAVFSEHATFVTLLLYNDQGVLLEEIPLPAETNRTENVWHILVEGLPMSGVLYGYKVGGEGGWETGHRWEPTKVFIDPYAPLIKGRSKFAVRDEFEQFKVKEGSIFRGTYDFTEAFDWGEDYKRPELEKKDLIVYEMCVRSYTADASSGLPEGERGTYVGLEKKIPHLVDLGINAVELLPVIEYDELEFQRTPNPRDHMVNIWGYSHINFFAIMSRFAANGGGPAAAAREFKSAVKAMHAAGIEVILDVVLNHTAEGGDDDPYPLCMRGFDNSVYYMVDKTQYVQLLNYSGCGNTVSGNHPVTQQMIVDCLRWWVEEYHVDGFRFDLASALCRDPLGNPIVAPPLIRQISKDPVLSKVHLIAEPWDCGGLYQVGSFPNWDVWSEWNGMYRDDIRRFIRGDPGLKSAFATRMAGSADLYHNHNRKPYHSINFVIAHDGFTLADLVSYNMKSNHDNGEGNKDGTNDNFSWNCGVEGPTDDPAVLALRQRQQRNLMMALLLAQGTPMVLSGDEYGQTRNGCNNWYGHDTLMTRFEWDKLEEVKDTFYRFYSLLIKFRKEHPLLGRAEFLAPGDVTWHEDNWDNPDGRFLAFTLHDKGQGGGDLYAAFNNHEYSVDVPLPQPPQGKKWSRVVDTNLAPPKDFTVGGNKGVDPKYCMQGHSSILLLAKDA